MNGVLGVKRNSGHMMGLPNGNTMPGVPDYSGKRARKVVSDVSFTSSLQCTCWGRRLQMQ